MVSLKSTSIISGEQTEIHGAPRWIAGVYKVRLRKSNIEFGTMEFNFDKKWLICGL